MGGAQDKALVNRAVVIGGGMAGLFAASALSAHAGEVVIVDRDDIPEDPVPRNGAPQSRHPHVLLFGGMDAMESWFPGFVDDVVSAGGIPGVAGRDFIVYRPEGRSYNLNGYAPEPSDRGTMYLQPRPVLEACVRRRVLSLPNVTLRQGTRVERLCHDGSRVTGVQTAAGETLEADLVIDASGRQSKTPEWLEEMGFDRPVQHTVGCDIAYATATVRPDDWDAFPEVFVGFGNANEGENPTRGGGFFKMPDGLWMVMLAGTHGDYPPNEWDAWCEFGRSVRYGPFAELIADVTPVVEPVPYRMPQAVRRRYESLERFPEGLIPIGDAIAFYNPLHGQGMSAAAGQCRALEASLAQRAEEGGSITGLWAEYFQQAAEWVRGAWALASAADFMNAQCTGDFPIEDMADVEQLIAFSLSDDVAANKLALDVGSLRLPLSAIRLPLGAA